MDQNLVKRRYLDRVRYRTNPRRRFNKYNDNARRKKLDFQITYQEALNFFLGACIYCGVIGSLEEQLLGIDRVDSSLPYTSSNCVPCCSMCNMMKGSLNNELFIQKCNDIAAHCK